MANTQNNEWEIESLQHRYKMMNGIELDKEQAKKVLKFEQKRKR